MIQPIEFTEKLPDILSRINLIIDELNAMQPRLIPDGGLVGQVLTKESSAAYVTGWETDSDTGGTGAGSGTLFPPVEKVASGTGPQSILLSAAQTRALLFINGLLARQADYAISSSEVLVPDTLQVIVGDVLTALDYPSANSMLFEHVASVDGEQIIPVSGGYTHAYVFVNGLLQGPFSYTIATDVVTIPATSNAQVGDLITTIMY